MSWGTRVSFAVCLFSIMGCGVVAAQAPQPFSADVSIISKTGQAGGKWFFSSPKIRIDMTKMPPDAARIGGSVSVIVDGATQTTYTLLPKKQMYMEDHGPNSNENPAIGRVGDLARWKGDPCKGQADVTCKALGSENVNGRACDKWEASDRRTARTILFWVDQKVHFPIRMKDEESDVEISNIKEGPQDAALFSVPPGYKPFDPSAFSPQK